MKYSHISLLTDYGLQDEFVGVMKSVMIDMAPHVTITDITHGVPAFDIRSGSLTLARAIQYVPKGIVIAVVDPGVGTNRRAIAIEVADGDGILLGPDNGLLAPAVAMAGGAQRAFALTNADLHLLAPGNTFAGRDIFAPVAAFLCNGGNLSEVGEEVDADLLVPGVVPLSQEETHDEYGAGLRCEITWIDSFGNCQLNVGIDDIAHLPAQLRVLVADDIRSMKVLANFAAIPTGGVGLVIDSYGMLALACDRESAASTLNVGTGDRVSLFAGDGDAGTTTSAVSLRSK